MGDDVDLQTLHANAWVVAERSIVDSEGMSVGSDWNRMAKSSTSENSN